MAKQDQALPAILRRPEVEARTGLCRSAIYAGMAEGTFPKNLKLGKRSVGWLSDQITAWINDRVRDSRKAA